MSRLNNATGSSAGPSLLLPTRNAPYSSNNNNSNMGPRPSLPLPTRSSSSSQTPSSVQIIDLTDSPPPQDELFAPASRGRSHGGSGPSRSGSSRVEVIDVDALPDSPVLPPRPSMGWQPPIARDPDVMFARATASRILGGSGGHHAAGRSQQHHHQQPHGFAPRPTPVEPSVLYNRFDRSARNAFQPRFYQELEDPILGHGGRIGQVIPDVNVGNMNVPGPYRVPGGAGGGGSRRGMAQDMMSLLNSFMPPVGQWQGPDHIDFNFQPPGQLDHRLRAPGIIREDSPSVDAARARNIDYKSPPPARDGFTRNPKESDILVCANCDSELGTPGDGPLSQEVWASRCGHVSWNFILFTLDFLLRPNRMHRAIAVLVSPCSVRLHLLRIRQAANLQGRGLKTVSLVVSLILQQKLQCSRSICDGLCQFGLCHVTRGVFFFLLQVHGDQAALWYLHFPPSICSYWVLFGCSKTGMHRVFRFLVIPFLSSPIFHLLFLDSGVALFFLRYS